MKNLDYFTLPTIEKDDIEPIEDGMKLEFELEGFKILNATTDSNHTIIVINDYDGITFGFQNLEFRLTGNYSFMTDPPLFADIGEADFYFAPLNFSTNVRTEIIRSREGHKMELLFSNTTISSDRDPFANIIG